MVSSADDGVRPVRETIIVVDAFAHTGAMNGGLGSYDFTEGTDSILGNGFENI